MIARKTFWLKVKKTKECWIFPGPRGKIKNEFGKQERAYRWIWKQKNGNIPKGKEICHKCNNDWCVRPSHLYAGTRSQNMFDAYAAGRIPTRKLTITQVKQIRNTHIKGLNRWQRGNVLILAKKYNVHWQTIKNIVKYRQWRSI